MINWIMENGSTVGVSLILLLLVGLVIRKLVRDKKQGVTACGTSCSGCAMAGSCKSMPNTCDADPNKPKEEREPAQTK